MKSILVIIIFLLSTTVCFSNQEDTLKYTSDSNQNEVLKPRSGVHDNDIMTPKPKVPSWDTISKNIDTLKKVSGDVYSMVKDGMKKEGIRAYMRKHADVFIPIVVFIILYLIWLARRARMRN
jgi:hypothetical protein